MLNMSEAEDSNSSSKINLELEVEKAEAVTAVGSSSNASDNENGTQPPNSSCNYLNKKWIVGTILVAVVTVLGATIGVSTSTTSSNPDIPTAPPTNAPTAKCNGEHLVEEVMKKDDNDNAAPEGIRRLIANTDTEYLSIGCFRTQDSPDKRPLMAITQEGKADECHSSCRTSYGTLEFRHNVLLSF